VGIIHILSEFHINPSVLKFHKEENILISQGIVSSSHYSCWREILEELLWSSIWI
jgi:hypothetical protein